MKNALGIEPVHNATIKSSEVCGSCHSVHLPIFYDGKTIGHTYEQTTYPEWAFSAYRTGKTPDGDLPLGAGSLAQSCQNCHMPSKDAEGNPYRSKIAEIQEHSNFPEAENALPAKDIDLRYARLRQAHAGRLELDPDEDGRAVSRDLGIRVKDPMLTTKGIHSIPATEAAMIDQAINRTADVVVGDVRNNGSTLSARVTINSKVGHKFPSGVGFRRAFIEFDVLDATTTRCGRPALPQFRRHRGRERQADRRRIVVERRLLRTHRARRAPASAALPDDYTAGRGADLSGTGATPPEGKTPVCGPAAQPEGPLTTSFLSICAKVKDNRLLPHGFLGSRPQKDCAGAGRQGRPRRRNQPVGVGNDPDYPTGGGDSSPTAFRSPT